jgi:hypothetical protein
MIAFTTVQGHMEPFLFGGIAERHASVRQLLSLNHEAGLQFYRENAIPGTALVIILS